MKTLIKIAWRNVWRNKLRSTIVMLSIGLGIWSGLFIMAMTLGMNEQRMSGAIDSYLSHIQIHHPKFQDDYNKKYTLIDDANLTEQLDTIPQIKAYSQRLFVTGMASTAKGNYGVHIMGIFPENEKKVTSISQQLIEGTYFKRLKQNPIVIGKKLADRLGLKINSKVVLNFLDKNNNTIANSFRVEGIFKTTNSIFDEGTVFVKYQDMAPLVGLEGKFHEVAILTDNMEDIKAVKSEIVTQDSVESWYEISPELGYTQTLLEDFMFIFMGIVLLALAFGIINIMLMAVLERRRELGMLLCIGMSKRKVFGMILLETLFIAFVATPLGMFLSYLSITYFGKNGIDLSIVSAGLESWGAGSKVFTHLPLTFYWSITLMTLTVAFLAALIPARRALKLNPAEAVKII